MLPLLALALTAAGGQPAPSPGCEAATTMLQAAIDSTAASGGGWARIPCGFHATLPLVLRSGVKIGSGQCTGTGPALLTFGACAPGTQLHIFSVGNGTGQALSGLVFDHTNLTSPEARSSAAVVGGSGATGFLLENSRFLNINLTSQGFSAIQLGGCSGCRVHGNFVARSGGDALNFNSGEYIVTENVVQNVGDGCIVRLPHPPAPHPARPARPPLSPTLAPNPTTAGLTPAFHRTHLNTERPAPALFPPLSLPGSASGEGPRTRSQHSRGSLPLPSHRAHLSTARPSLIRLCVFMSRR